MSDRTTVALREMAASDPELAARLVVQGLPAAARRLRGPLAYELEVEGLGAWRVRVDADGAARVVDAAAEADGDGTLDFRLRTDARGLAELAAGESPLRLVLGGRVRIRGSRRRALRLRALADGAAPTLADVAQADGQLDLDAVQRALAYLIDPEWTRGHRFVVAYELAGDEHGPGGCWYVHVRDGERVRVTTEPPQDEPLAATATLPVGVFRRLAAREISPAAAMRDQLTRVRGSMYPMILLGRWIERAQGNDEAELEREVRQRAEQERRRGTWGSRAQAARAAGAPGQGDPGHAEEGERRAGRDLLGYHELYALWEAQNWRAHELDFSQDREHWVASPVEAQENIMWSLGSFYVGEERVTADLAPFLLAAPSGEVEMFLATQLVDEARHAAFFDRFGAEVMVLSADDLRGRMKELDERVLGDAWHRLFDDGLREISERIKQRPDDLDLFVEGIATYHMVIEGVMAMTGQRFILQYLEEHELYPGFREGFSLVERDEHRHIAFGVRFLKEMVERDRRHGEIVQRRICELVPQAVLAFVPPYADDPGDFVTYGYHSSQIYGYAYRTLKRRMNVVGLSVPAPEELMPGPIAAPDEARAAGVPA
jgi:ribonucleoside-diphosphate reductase beta chain